MVQLNLLLLSPTYTHTHPQHTQADSDISLDGLAQVRAITLYRDDKKSLGFNIEKGELGTAPTVLISNLTPGGPAELSGSLQVGDQILSVDGQKILGYAYEKVWKLAGCLKVDCHALGGLIVENFNNRLYAHPLF